MFDSRKNIFIFLFAFLFIMFMITNITPASAQVGTPEPSDDEINAIARKLYCPVCDNVPLDICSTQACAQWRELIREKLILGWNEEQIILDFADQYGDSVLATPPVRDVFSLNMLAYIIPPLALLIGILIIIRYMTKDKNQIIPDVSTSPSLSSTESNEKYRKQLDDFLNRTL